MPTVRLQYFRTTTVVALSEAYYTGSIAFAMATASAIDMCITYFGGGGDDGGGRASTTTNATSVAIRLGVTL